MIVWRHVATDCDVTGYKGMNNDPNKEWVMEAKDGEQFEEGSDPFLAKSRAKKEAMQVLLYLLAIQFIPTNPTLVHRCCRNKANVRSETSASRAKSSGYLRPPPSPSPTNARRVRWHWSLRSSALPATAVLIRGRMPPRQLLKYRSSLLASG